MSGRSFSPWVEPIAARLREGRSDIVNLARSLPAERWGRASAVEGWTYKDILSHLAAGDVFCQIVINNVVSGGEPDLRPTSGEREGRTARILDERRNRGIDDLIEEVATEGEETQQLLARLTDFHEASRVYTSRSSGTPVSLGEFLRVFRHDQEHIAHLRAAVEA